MTLLTLKTLLLRLPYCSSRRIKGCHIKKCSICHFSAGYPSLMVTRLKKFLNLVLESSSSELTYPTLSWEALEKVFSICLFISALLLKDNYDFLLNLLSTNVLFPQSKGRRRIKGFLFSFIALWFKDLFTCYWLITLFNCIKKLLFCTEIFVTLVLKNFWSINMIFFSTKHYSWPIVFYFSWQSKQKIWRNCIGIWRWSPSYIS